MSKKKTLKEQLKDVMAKLKGDEPVALTLQDGTGKEIVFTESDNPSVGDKATVDGSPAEGEITMPDGTVYVFVSGELTEIRPAGQENGQMNADAVRKIVSEEIEKALAKVKKSVDDDLALVVEATETLTENYSTLARSVKSNFKMTPKPGDEKKLGGKEKDDVYSKYQPKKKED